MLRTGRATRGVIDSDLARVLRTGSTSGRPGGASLRRHTDRAGRLLGRVDMGKYREKVRGSGGVGLGADDCRRDRGHRHRGADTSAPGVSATQINVGAISSLSGPLAGFFGGLAPGMIAYFNTLNAKGGVNGRKIVLTNNLDDGGSPTQFTQDVHTLIDQDHVFAAAVPRPGSPRATSCRPRPRPTATTSRPTGRPRPTCSRSADPPRSTPPASRRWRTSSRRSGPSRWPSSATGPPSPRPTTPATAMPRA